MILGYSANDFGCNAKYFGVQRQIFRGVISWFRDPGCWSGSTLRQLQQRQLRAGCRCTTSQGTSHTPSCPMSRTLAS
eukprot:3938292-Rhodomonas_salina.6